jgi:predicted DNA-binding transcriptional regulator AlpA
MEHGERLTMSDLQARLGGISETTLRRLIAEHHFPPPFLVGRTRYWWEADVTAYQWLATRGAFNAPAVDWTEGDDDEPPDPAKGAPKRPRSPQSPPSGT